MLGKRPRNIVLDPQLGPPKCEVERGTWGSMDAQFAVDLARFRPCREEEHSSTSTVHANITKLVLRIFVEQMGSRLPSATDRMDGRDTK